MHQVRIIFFFLSRVCFYKSVFDTISDKEYSHFAIQRTSSNRNETLLNLKSLLAICELEQRISAIELYDGICLKEMNSNNCCRMWSIPNYIALLSNKTSCYEIDVSIIYIYLIFV